MKKLLVFLFVFVCFSVEMVSGEEREVSSLNFGFKWDVTWDDTRGTMLTLIPDTQGGMWDGFAVKTRGSGGEYEGFLQERVSLMIPPRKGIILLVARAYRLHGQRDGAYVLGDFREISVNNHFHSERWYPDLPPIGKVYGWVFTPVFRASTLGISLVSDVLEGPPQHYDFAQVSCEKVSPRGGSNWSKTFFGSPDMLVKYETIFSEGSPKEVRCFGSWGVKKDGYRTIYSPSGVVVLKR